MNLCELKLKDGDVVVCTWSNCGYFTEWGEYPLAVGLIVDDDGDSVSYCSDDSGLWEAGFELKKPLEVKEEFDIDNYKPYWVDRISKQSDGNVTLHSQHSGFTLNKQDAIAIAKHFKLTGEDL